MKFLKSEFSGRQSDSATYFRDDDGIMQPEQLCDHDVLIWRQNEHSYYNFRRDGVDHRHDEGVDLVRKNELAGITRDVNQTKKDFMVIRETIYRVSV